jgi:hypothetical protein
MNESDLEKELRSLLPAKPSARLAERIAAELNVPIPLAHEPAAGLLSRPAKQRAPRFTRFWLLALSGAAAIVIGFVAVALWTKPGLAISSSKPEHTTAVVALNEDPDESVAELVDARDEGVIFDADDEPQWQVRMVYLERHTWTNSQTGTVVEFEVPREDIVLMPVAMQ